MIRVTYCRSHSDNRPNKRMPLTEVFNGNVQTQMALRTRFTDQGAEAYKKMREDIPLPALIPASQWVSDGKETRSKEVCVRHHSGFVMIDVDGLDDEKAVNRVRGLARCDVYGYGSGTSLSGRGVHIFVRVSPVPRTVEEHVQAWREVKDYYHGVLGVPVDESCKDPSRLCYLSYDIHALWNEDAWAFPWKMPQPREIKRPANRPVSRKYKLTPSGNAPPMPDEWDTHRLLRRAQVGERRNVLLAFIGDIHGQLGWEPDEVSRAAHAANRKFCDPPLDEREVDEVVFYVCKNYPKGSTATAHGQGQPSAHGPMQRATALAGDEDVDFPPVYEPYTVGRWCVANAQENGLYYQYDIETKEWYLATDTHWKQFDYGHVRGAYADVFVPMLLAKAGFMVGTTDGDEKNQWRKNFNVMERGAVMNHTLFQDALRDHLSIALSPPQKHLIATAGGIVDLKHYTVRPFDPQVDTHTAAMPVAVTASDFKTPGRDWIDFVDGRLGAEQSDYAQRMLGMALAGESQRSFLGLIGPAGCGKSTFVLALQTAMGRDMAKTVSENLFHPRGNHNDDLANLIQHQSRVCILPEANNARLNAPLLNQITGGDDFTTRRAHGKGQVSGKVIAMPIVYGERPPNIYGTTRGTIERQSILSFEPLDREERNPQLIADAKNAHSEMVKQAFIWMVTGAQTFYTYGTPAKPDVVVQASLEALSEQDPLTAWIIENEHHWHGKSSTEIARMYNEEMTDVQDARSFKAVSHIVVGRTMGGLNYTQTVNKMGGQRREWSCR